MPWIDVKLFDTRVTEDSVPRIIEALTSALAESSGASPDHIHVLVQGIPAPQWGTAGKPLA
jgi:4-oxalocrotonate tautomerase